PSVPTFMPQWLSSMVNCLNVNDICRHIVGIVLIYDKVKQIAKNLQNHPKIITFGNDTLMTARNG
ncbi:MAG: hypothetical protein K2J10_02625, partial [Muribaculaceae bacterium]|nr:hypothetical protein [Muribaculaceae bacterium]